MALADNELLVTTTDVFPVRSRVRVDEERTVVFANSAGAELLAKLTPIAYNTSTGKYVVWTNGGVNGTGTIVCFVGMTAVQLDATDDVNGGVIWKGEIDYRDVVLPSGELQANLEAELKTNTLRLRGITIVGPEFQPAG